MSPYTDDIRFEVHGRLGIVTLDRAPALNALSREMVQRLSRQLVAWKDDPQVAAARLDHGRGEQRERVGAPGDADQQARGEVAGAGVVGELLEPLGEGGAHGAAGTGDHGRRAGHQSTCTISAATSSTAARAASASAPSKPWTTIE